MSNSYAAKFNVSFKKYGLQIMGYNFNNNKISHECLFHQYSSFQLQENQLPD